MPEPSWHNVVLPFVFQLSTSSIKRGKWLFAVVCLWADTADQSSGTRWCHWHKREGQKDHPSAQRLFSAYRDTPQTSATALLSAQSQLEAEYS